MTVTYSLEVGTTRLGGFAKLLLRWRGSIYKLMYREMVIFTILYYALAALYRLVMNKNQQRIFEDMSSYCRAFTDLIPITFVMGFYVALVVGRWWNQYLCIPWPDNCVLMISAFVQGNDERGRLIRRALARYINVMAVLTLQNISIIIRKRFPTLDHLVESGIMTEDERRALDDTVAPHGNWWIPSAWFGALAVEARKEGRIEDDILLKTLIDELMKFRANCGLLWSYDWISVPLVYTQVVTIAVYAFFGACLMGRQYLYANEAHSYEIDRYIPVFTLFQFFFYMGWLKVAEQLINPFGEDDDDFELNWVVDRNIQMSYCAVDDLYKKRPKLEKDAFWDEPEPEIPYTAAAAEFKMTPFIGSTAEISINKKEAEWHLEPTVAEEHENLNENIADEEAQQAGLNSEHASPHQKRRIYQAKSLVRRLISSGSGHSLTGLGSRLGSRLSITSKASCLGVNSASKSSMTRKYSSDVARKRSASATTSVNGSVRNMQALLTGARRHDNELMVNGTIIHRQDSNTSATSDTPSVYSPLTCKANELLLIPSSTTADILLTDTSPPLSSESAAHASADLCCPPSLVITTASAAAESDVSAMTVAADESVVGFMMQSESPIPEESENEQDNLYRDIDYSSRLLA